MKKDELTEQTPALVAAFKAGQKEVFDQLVVMYSPKLYRTVCGLLDSKQDAEEVVQDAFLRAYRSLDHFRGDCSFETWMHRIAVNLARNRFHWNQRRGEGKLTSISEFTDEDGTPQELLLPDDRMRPDRSLENMEIGDDIMKGLHALPESIRETMFLRHVDDFSYEEIAQMLDCKIGTVKSRLARGRDMLRDYLISMEQTVPSERRI